MAGNVYAKSRPSSEAILEAYRTRVGSQPFDFQLGRRGACVIHDVSFANSTGGLVLFVFEVHCIAGITEATAVGGRTCIYKAIHLTTPSTTAPDAVYSTWHNRQGTPISFQEQNVLACIEVN
jgi:hypothetical protein